MKKLIIILSAFVALSFLAISAQAQCNAELYNNIALKKLAPGYTFVKSYRIDGKGGPKGLIATLYDSKRSQLSTSYVSDRFFHGWVYKCKATGIYYLSFTFKDSKNFCGAAVLGFRR